MRITDEQIAQLKDQSFLIVKGFLSPPEAQAALAGFFESYPPFDQWLARGKPGAQGPWIFPFDHSGLNHACTHPDLIDAAQRVTGTRDVRLCEAHLGMKYATEAYGGGFHTDFGNNTLGPEPHPSDMSHLVAFYCFDEVKPGGAPILMVPRGQPDSAAVPMICPPGSVCFYGLGTRHSASPFTITGVHRASAWVSFNQGDRPWEASRAFTYKSGSLVEGMARFLREASPRQRELLGFPPAGDPRWTDDLIDGMARRYPGFDPRPYREARPYSA